MIPARVRHPPVRLEAGSGPRDRGHARFGGRKFGLECVRGGRGRGTAAFDAPAGGVVPRRPLQRERVADAAARGPSRASVGGVVFFVVAPAGRSDFRRRRCGLSATGSSPIRPKAGDTPHERGDNRLGRDAEYRTRFVQVPAKTVEKKCSLVLSRRRNFELHRQGDTNLEPRRRSGEWRPPHASSPTRSPAATAAAASSAAEADDERRSPRDVFAAAARRRFQSSSNRSPHTSRGAGRTTRERKDGGRTNQRSDRRDASERMIQQTRTIVPTPCGDAHDDDNHRTTSARDDARDAPI